MIQVKASSKFELENLDNTKLEKAYTCYLNGKVLIDKTNRNLAILSEDELKWSGMDFNEHHYLGRTEDNAFYASEVKIESHLLDSTEWIDLRNLLGLLPDSYFQICSRGIQLVDWYASNKFCGRCSQPMKQHELEKAMYCSCNPTLIYPKISPCIIVLVTKGEHLLLAHNKNFPADFYSTLAGFVEAGETVEEAIFREIKEEVNIEVSNISYFGSQSWPFPSQLMLGFHARYDQGEITPDGEEIDKANWFHFQSLPKIPPAKISISGQLIKSYVEKLEKKNSAGHS